MTLPYPDIFDPLTILQKIFQTIARYLRFQYPKMRMLNDFDLNLKLQLLLTQIRNSSCKIITKFQNLEAKKNQNNY